MLRPFRYRLAAALLISFAAGAAAAPVLTVTPPRLALLVLPGGSETRTLTVVNETSLPVVTKLSFRDRHFRSDGTVETFASGVHDRSAAPWLDLDVRFLELSPWQKKEITLRAEVPPEISGSYWCDLVLEPVGDKVAGMDVAVRIQVDGAGTVERRVSVEWSSFAREEDGRIRTKLRAANEGNAFLSGRGSLLVRGESTPTLENIPLAFFGTFEVEPESHRDFDLVTRSPLPAGRYWMGVQIDIGRGEFVQKDTIVEFAAPPPDEKPEEEARPTPSPPPAEKPPDSETVRDETPPLSSEEASAAGAKPDTPPVESTSTAAAVSSPEKGDGPGYRVQLYATGDRTRAEAFAAATSENFTVPVYFEFIEPFHKVFLGRSLTKREALSLRKKAIAAGYEGAWVTEARLAPVPPAEEVALEPPAEAPESAALRPPDDGLAYRVRLFSSADEKEAVDYRTAVETVFRHPLFVESDADGEFVVFVGPALSGADAWAALERAKSFGFDDARIVQEDAPVSE